MTGPDVTGVGEYAEKAARDAITESEARAMALQGIVELSRGVDIAVSEIRKGLFMQAAETLLLAKAGCVVAEAAIQKIRTEEARAEERERIADELRQAAYDRHRGPHDTEESTLLIVARNLDAGFPVGGSNTSQAVARVLRVVAARIARGEAT